MIGMQRYSKNYQGKETGSKESRPKDLGTTVGRGRLNYS